MCLGDNVVVVAGVCGVIFGSAVLCVGVDTSVGGNGCSCACC